MFIKRSFVLLVYLSNNYEFFFGSFLVKNQQNKLLPWPGRVLPIQTDMG